MKKLILGICVIYALTMNHAEASSSWQLLHQPRQRIVKSIATYKDKIFIGTGNGIYLSDDGKNWDDFGSNKLRKDFNGNSVINSISIDEALEKIFIATSFGAYVSDLHEPMWTQFFEDQKTESSNVNFITLNDENIFLSANDGFWICSKDEAQSCDRINQGLVINNLTGLPEVFHVLNASFGVLVASTEGVYRLEDDDSWVKSARGIDLLPEGYLSSGFLFENKNKVWFACSTGAYLSEDNGYSWKKYSNGIRGNQDGYKNITSLFLFDNILYASSSTGVYFLNSDRWEDVGDGLRSIEGNKNVYLLEAYENDLLAATDEGLFVLRFSEEEKSNTDFITLKGRIETQFTDIEGLEPSVIEVQREALKFAGIPTYKDFRRYKLQSRLRNLLPSIDFDLSSTLDVSNYMDKDYDVDGESTSADFDFDRNRSARLQRDKRRLGLLSVTWNTGELLYDDEISDIVGQARLSANVRENILDDITRIYFERRRLQLESLVSPPAGTEEKLSNYIEIAELTGQIDSRTGGWFSRDIEKRKKIKIN